MEISIIIPVYNKALFVRQCLTRALAQDFDSYQVVAVDDGSTDGSGDICDEMALQNARLRVVHQQNGGVTAARRRGVDEACGEYVMFCDADDELLPHALRNAYEAMTLQQADEVIAPYRNQRGDVFDSGRRGLVPASDIVKDFLATRNSFPPNCAILFRRSMLKGCFSIPRDIVMGEDILFHIAYLMKASRVFCIGEVNYVYNQGVSGTYRYSLEHEKLYDEVLRRLLASQWDELRPWFVLRQLKSYERFVNQGDLYVREAYYQRIAGDIDGRIPLADRVSFYLPPRLSYYLITFYKKWLNRKSRRITTYS